jgi:hypothetical protein
MNDLPPAALFAIIIFIAIFLIFAFLALDAVWEQTKADRAAKTFEPCPRCGKPVSSGGELYHEKRCRGIKSQRSYRFGKGERIDR